MVPVDRLRKNYLKKLFIKLKKSPDSPWPELKTYDYVKNFQISKEEYNKNKRHVFAVYPVERLFEYIALLGGSREEAVRALIFMEVVIDAEKCYLDVSRAREELQIPELIEKYMVGDE